ncbi:GLE1-domain-containing protein [Trichodelitschia bisporula]|uniref:mRNA export factor GLE1 n=1 Tax=Trichodelitschia bisporula TaxID=703511 RepID=A0A6G1I013_9PEZI|nr:GLE1-domain-containing protein [Trichodelitschia bisporula]
MRFTTPNRDENLHPQTLPTPSSFTSSSPIDSPSAQLFQEISNRARSQTVFNKQWDRSEQMQSENHAAALKAAHEEHERVRIHAELFHAECLRERERKRQQEQEREALELTLLRRKNAEEEARHHQNLLNDVKKKAEQAEREAEQLKRSIRLEQEAHAAREAELKADAERRADAERQAQQAAALKHAVTPRQPAVSSAPAVALPAQQATTAPATNMAPSANGASTATATTTPAPTAGSTSVPPPQLDTPVEELERLHKRYLEIHQYLKEHRRKMARAIKSDPSLSVVSDWRRDITKLLGQLTNERDPSVKTEKERNEMRRSNTDKRNKVYDALGLARDLKSAMIDVRLVCANPPPEIAQLSNENAQVSASLVFLLNMLSKTAIRQFINSGAVTTFDPIEPIGITVSMIFSRAGFRFHGYSLMDIFLAKYHFACPVLFGIYGPERTPTGMRRLGWYESEGEFIGRQEHNERMAGLAAGWSAITLRNYLKTKHVNCLPPWVFWQTLARIVNTPKHQVTQTHFVVLRGLLERNFEMFHTMYQDFALIALRRAVVDFPNSVPKNTAADGVMVLRDVIESRLKVRL